MIFNKFPKVLFDVEQNGVSSVLVDIFKYVTIKRDKLDKLISYSKYRIIEGERPDVVSYKLYGREDYHWTFFLINDHLRQGLTCWPKSYGMFNDWINDQYGKYSVMEFLPNVAVTPSVQIGTKIYYNLNQADNYFGAIDFTNQYLKIESSTGGLAKCNNYDFNNLQLWSYDHEVEDKVTFNSAPYFKLNFDLTAPYDDYRAWLDDMLFYYEKSRQIDYINFLNDIDENEIIPYTEEYYNFFYNNYVSSLQFTPTNAYANAEYAPKYYHELNDESELVSNYTAIKDGGVTAISYKEHEETINDENAFIKVIDPNFIDTFVEAFIAKVNE